MKNKKNYKNKKNVVFYRVYFIVCILSCVFYRVYVIVCTLWCVLYGAYFMVCIFLRVFCCPYFIVCILHNANLSLFHATAFEFLLFASDCFIYNGGIAGIGPMIPSPAPDAVLPLSATIF